MSKHSQDLYLSTLRFNEQDLFIEFSYGMMCSIRIKIVQELAAVTAQTFLTSEIEDHSHTMR
jgi:hypothetical protein